MKKRFIASALVLVLIASIFTFAGCSSKTDEAETINIGVFGPTSGPIAAYGKAVVDSVTLAVEEINKAGGIDGKQIKLFTYDSKGDKTEAVNIYNRLKDQDKVVAIIGGTISGETLAIKELAKADNMPILTPTATSAEVTLGAPSIFRACFLDPYQAAAAAKFSIDTLEAKSVAILYNSEDAYSQGLAEAYKKSFDDAGLTTTNYIGYTASDADYSTYLTQIKDSNPDIIFLPDYYDKVGKIATQIKSMGLTQVCVGVDGWDSVEINYATQVEGYYFVNHFAKTDPDETVQNFIKSFKAKYDMEPNALGALGYDAAYVMADAIKKAGATDADSIVKALQATEYKGVTGNIRFDDEGDAAQKDIAIIKLVGGKHELVEKIVVK
ncbi:MAG: ABC transporter substrate-binding protein [Eubacteriaceae bacterium]|nr:ABC transporter substrate-binding protein [Eubacteriaceae bacterium]